MERLKEIETKNGFVYNLVMRDENKALYEQRDKQGLLHGHEAFYIKKRKAEQAFGRDYPERELFPSNDAFGHTAWSVGIDRDIAICKYEKL